MAGTYFYHSHVGFQAVSAAGPLIVDHHIPPYHYDEERIVFLQDVFTKNDSTIEAGLANNPLVWSGETSMVLVNGQGGGTANGTVCNASLSTIDIEPGKTYRVRFIGATALTFASLAIEGHESLIVIEADGLASPIPFPSFPSFPILTGDRSTTQPYNTSHLQLGAGQRYSILLTTLHSPTKPQYYIQLESRERPTLTRGFAVLNYGAKPQTPPSPPAVPVLTFPNTTYGFLDYALRPYSHQDIRDFPTAAEVTRRVTIRVHQHVNGRTIWLENGVPWTEGVPQEPYLVSLYKNDGLEFPSMERALANNGIDPVTSAFPAQVGEVLEIVIQNTGADSGGLDVHPWHAHGAHYYDIGAGNGTYNATANEIRLQGTQPVKRDTTMLYRFETATGNGTDAGWRAWRLRVTDVGVWMVHCHILEHMLMGMQAAWVMGNETELLERVPRLDVEGYLNYGGNVYGNKSHWPEVVHYQDDWEGEQK
jgi:L-ascorbate oxidase